MVVYERTKPDVGEAPILGLLHHMPDLINLSSLIAYIVRCYEE